MCRTPAAFCFIFLCFLVFVRTQTSSFEEIDIARYVEDFVKREADLRVSTRKLTFNETAVNTSLGNIIGTEQNGYRLFQGIPYAQPPVGENRWQPPGPPSAWDGDLMATEFGAACPQGARPTNSTPFITTPISEDCLSLNIWTPPTSSLNDTLVPVMVWFHGGAFWSGWGGDGLFWGDYLVNSSSNTIVVTINYRLGVLGFFNSPELSGNYGFLDQQMALRWVQDHISNFGGDPNRVTIFGQSAGAMSATLHAIVPSSDGLFSRVIAESNPVGLNYRTPEENYPYSQKVAGILGCDYTDTACLQTKTFEEIIDAQTRSYIITLPITTLEFLPYCPIIDGTIIPTQPMDLYRAGKVNTNVEAIAFGVNRNESAIVFPFNFPLNELFYKKSLDVFFAENATEVLDQYPASRSTSNLDQLSILSTDWLFLCSTRFAVRAFANSNVPTYMYHFMHAPSNDPINTNPPCIGAVCHSAELSFVRNSIDFVEPGSFTPAEEKLSWGFINYWLNFAHGKVSSTLFGPAWPRYDQNTDNALDFDIPDITTLAGYHSDNCDFWDSLGYYN